MINDTCQATADRHTERLVPRPTGGLLGVTSSARAVDPRIRSGQTRGATTLNRTQIPTPNRQPPISAIGRAKPDATAAVAPSTVEYRPVTNGTSVGKSRFTSSGTTTLPTAIAAPITIVPIHRFAA